MLSICIITNVKLANAKSHNGCIGGFGLCINRLRKCNLNASRRQAPFPHPCQLSAVIISNLRRRPLLGPTKNHLRKMRRIPFSIYNWPTVAEYKCSYPLFGVLSLLSLVIKLDVNFASVGFGSCTELAVIIAESVNR